MAKIINSNYPSIQHLPFSKMSNRGDKNLDEREVGWLTKKTRLPTDIVIVTEKVDGCNVGVLRRGDILIPIGRKGYDVRTSGYTWIQEFAGFVERNGDRFMALLEDGERVCGEWMIKTHTIVYDMHHEPFICFDIIKDNTRVRYSEAYPRFAACGFTGVGLVHHGSAISTDKAIASLGEGFHGAVGQPEGVVYRYESEEKGYLFGAKFVNHPLVGDQALLDWNMETNLMNKWGAGECYEKSSRNWLAG
jgi:hypothetical protein